MRKYMGAIFGLLMWASGTGLVLVTLSGDTLQKAFVISLVTLAVSIAAIAFGVGVDE